MSIGNSIFRILIFSLVMLILKSAGSAHAINRNDVFAELEKINTNWNDISIKLWINDFESEEDPGVLVGDRLTYRVETDKPAFFVLILVDPKGNTAVLKPDALITSNIAGASESLTFPDIEEGDSFQDVIQQAEPLGKETIYLLASDQLLSTSIFDIDSSTDYVNYGTDVGKVTEFVARLNAGSVSFRLASARYEYFVDSDTQFSTRGIRREITDRIKEVEVTTASTKDFQAVKIVKGTPVKSSPIVINDIKFEYDSDVLSSTGMSQLEILGSELIDRQEDNELPKVLLTGHTDSSGSAAYNMDLSIRRSAASKRFLVDELGLPAQYIDTNGLGESSPIEGNDTSDGRARNRRVEFEIVQQ